jgi:multiple sugar transport system substrate-binding protein
MMTYPLNRRVFMGATLGSVWLESHAAGQNPVKLRVAAYPLVDEIIRAAMPDWKKIHPNVDIEVVSRQYLDHHTAMTTALSTSAHLPDVMTLESSFVGRFSHGSGLQDLSQSPFDLGQFRNRFVPYAFDHVINAKGAMLAVPTDLGPGTMLYRQDLMAKAGISESQLSESWESYVDAGIQLKAKTGSYLIGSAQAIKDIVIRSGIGEGEGQYFDQNSRVLVKSPRFVRAFKLAQKVRQHQLDARVNNWSNEWAEGFRRGSLATDLTGAWMVGQMANWVAPQTKGLWRATHLPNQSYVGYGGSFYAIPTKSDPSKKNLAWDFIKLMTMNASMQFKAFQSQDAFPALLETHQSDFFNEPISFLGSQKARLIWREAAKKISSTKIHKQNNFADEVIGVELDNVLHYGKSIEAALNDAHLLLEKRAKR